MNRVQKFDQDKPPLDLLAKVALELEAQVMAFGARKYSKHGWRSGTDMNWTRLTAAAMRHIFAFNEGEDLDPESGLSHLAHARCCLAFLIEYQMKELGIDDRYKGNK